MLWKQTFFYLQIAVEHFIAGHVFPNLFSNYSLHYRRSHLGRVLIGDKNRTDGRTACKEIRNALEFKGPNKRIIAIQLIFKTYFRLTLLGLEWVLNGSFRISTFRNILQMQTKKTFSKKTYTYTKWMRNQLKCNLNKLIVEKVQTKNPKMFYSPLQTVFFVFIVDTI